MTALEGDYELATSTLLCVDLSNSTLSVGSPYDRLLEVDIASFYTGAAVGPGRFSGEYALNSGITFTRGTNIAGVELIGCSDPELIMGTATRMSGTLATHTQAMDLLNSCPSSHIFLGIYFAEGSIVRFKALDPGLGIPVDGLRFTNPNEPGGLVFEKSSSIITIQGEELYTELDLVWTGSRQSFIDHTLSLEADLKFDPANRPLGRIEMTIFAGQHEGAMDDPPYEGSAVRCEPWIYELPTVTTTVDLANLQPSLPSWPEVTVLDLVAIISGGAQ